MLGWEYPPLINGGLGVACHGLSQALAEHVSLSMLLPRVEMTAQDSQVTLIGIDDFTDANRDQSSSSPLLQPYESSSPPSSGNENLYDGDLFARVSSYTRAALAYAKNATFDLIHAHDWMTALAGLEIQRATGKPLVFHVHSLVYDRVGPDLRDWAYEIEKKIIAEADLTITVSHYTRQICINHYGGSPSRIFTVHNGVAPVSPFRSKPPFPEKIVSFFGRLTHQKSPHSFLKIAAKILEKSDDVRFVIAGTGDQLPSLIEESIARNIGDKVHFPGFLNRKEIHQLLSQTHVYCMPSVSEPFGLSALEAAQFGIPVVLSQQSGATEVLTSARSADAWDLERMTAHIEELLNNEPAHHSSSQAMLAEQKKCTWERAAEKIYGLYLMNLLGLPDY